MKSQKLGIGTEVISTKRFGLNEVPVGTHGHIIRYFDKGRPIVRFDPPYDKHRMKGKVMGEAQFVLESDEFRVSKKQNPYTPRGKDDEAKAQAFAVVPIENLKEAIHERGSGSGYTTGPLASTRELELMGKDGKDVLVYGSEPTFDEGGTQGPDAEITTKGRLIDGGVYFHDIKVTGLRGFAREQMQDYADQSYPDTLKELEAKPYAESKARGQAFKDSIAIFLYSHGLPTNFKTRFTIQHSRNNQRYDKKIVAGNYTRTTPAGFEEKSVVDVLVKGGYAEIVDTTSGGEYTWWKWTPKGEKLQTDLATVTGQFGPGSYRESRPIEEKII